jgi:hypothetical protein
LTQSRSWSKRAAAAEIVRGSDGPESEASKTLSHQRETSSITIFLDVDNSEESRTLSCGPGISGNGTYREGSEEKLSPRCDMSEASDKLETSKHRVVACRIIANIQSDVDETTTNAMNVDQNANGSTRGDDENNRLKRSYDTDSDLFSPTYEDSLSQRDANEARIYTEFKARKTTKSVQV